MKALRRLFVALATLVATGSPAQALAEPSRTQCVEAYERAQYTRLEMKLRDARDALLVCSQATCPTVTKNDCVPWLAEVERAIPTFTVAVRDERGRDLDGTKLTIDGATQMGGLSGGPVAVDPGPHKLRVELADGRTAEDQMIARTGEKDRVVAIVIKDAAGAMVPDSPASPELPPPPPQARPLVLPIGFTALGVVGVATAVVIGVTAKDESEYLRTSCSPRCSSSDISAVETKLLLSDVALGVGIVSLAVATYFWLKPPTRSAAGVAAGGRTGARSATFVIRF